MTAAAIFAACAQRRREVADFVDSLSDEQLAVASMCASWDVRTVVGHLVVPLVVRAPRMGLSVVRHGGDFHGANTGLARKQARRPLAELTAALRARAESSFTPPGQGPAAPFTDLCVHTADMRVPLGLEHDIRPDEAGTCLELITGSGKFLVPRRRLNGLSLRPDDLDRTWGDGEPVRGKAADLLLAALGRRPFAARLTGTGARILAERIEAT